MFPQRNISTVTTSSTIFYQQFKFQSMGVRKLFPGEGKNFPGGQEPTFCLKNNEKDTIFPKKSKNKLFLAGQGGGKGPLALPCGRPCFRGSVKNLFFIFFHYFSIIYFTT
jgi:hypothetical protein